MMPRDSLARGNPRGMIDGAPSASPGGRPVSPQLRLKLRTKLVAAMVLLSGSL